jgi:hypothetical protein
MADYLADPCPEPSLSTDVVDNLHRYTPLRAWTYHPRLGRRQSKSTPRTELGSAVHSLVLGGPAVVYAPAQYDNWKKGAAQDFRDGAESDGTIALLDRQREAVERAAERSRQALADFGAGRSEVTLCWTMGAADGDFATKPVWCRGRADWLDDAGNVDVDLKTVVDLDPDEWERNNIIPNAYDVQAGLRSGGHLALTGKPRQMLWLLQDVVAPFDCCLVGLAPSKLAIAERKVARAAGLFRQCLETKVWPGYGKLVRYAEAKPWEERDFAERASVPVGA